MNESDTYNNKKQLKQTALWLFALAFGAITGCLGINPLNEAYNIIATIFTRLFQFLAIPTVSLALITTMSELGAQKNTGRIFARTVIYTMLTTFASALVGLLLYIIISPGNLPPDIVNTSENAVNTIGNLTYKEHLISLIPDNVIEPFVSGNVLSVIIISAAAGIGLSFSPNTENKEIFIKSLKGLQELIFTLIKGIIKILPLGIAAFAAQLSMQFSNGTVIGLVAKYTAVVLAGNLVQSFVVIPAFLAAKRLNPLTVFKKMSKALTVAFFTKSSAGTLPVTMNCAEQNLNINPSISRFVLPVCTTVNMNGCAAFILVTSLFVMQNAGITLSPLLMISWLFISVFAAIGNAGVPMGCYFLTLSLMSSINVPLGILGIILPIYTILDMVETFENVWSDSAVCVMTDKDLKSYTEHGKD